VVDISRRDPGACEEELGGGEMWGVDHLPIVEERQPAVRSVAFELGDQLGRAGDLFGGLHHLAFVTVVSVGR
jgi:hypothetical protein